jgi:hypothetical protein
MRLMSLFLLDSWTLVVMVLGLLCGGCVVGGLHCWDIREPVTVLLGMGPVDGAMSFVEGHTEFVGVCSLTRNSKGPQDSRVNKDVSTTTLSSS